MTRRLREPVRTCVGCREAAERASLLRVVLGPDGSVAPDPAGRAPGRGAYVHRVEACIEAAVRRGALPRALRADPSTSGGPHEHGAARLIEVLCSVAGTARDRPRERDEQGPPPEQPDGTPDGTPEGTPEGTKDRV